MDRCWTACLNEFCEARGRDPINSRQAMTAARATIVDPEDASMRRDNDRSIGEEMRPLARERDLETLDRGTRWELVGCVILLVIAVLMAIAVNAYVP